jgi:hypothetical protein
VLKAEWIFVNVGGRAVVPEVPGLDQVEYLTNSSILDLDVLPPHLLIIGPQLHTPAPAAPMSAMDLLALSRGERNGASKSPL